MKADDQSFSHIIEGSKQFKIPVFQRDYRWTTAQCSQLWKDINLNSRSDTEQGHFIGSIVYMAAEEIGAAFNQWLVVDGQQRLTSLTLLMVALRDHLREVGWAGNEDSPTPERIDAYFLKNTYESGKRKYKLMLRRADDATLRALVDSTELPEMHSSLINDAYEHFRNLLTDCNPARIYRDVSRLKVVDVRLDRHHDDPQLVFESLNSTGVDLGPSDLIRNYLLMRLPESTQTSLYEKHWSGVERSFRSSNEGLNSFLRDYTAVKTETTRQIRHDRIYAKFKETFRFSQQDGNVETQIAQLSRAARHYAAFYIRPVEEGGLADALRSLRQYGDTTALLVMCLYDRYDRGVLSIDDFIEALVLVESYLVRRAVCGLQTRNYWTVFAKMALKLTDKSPLVDLKVAFSRQDTYEFPSAAAFKRALLEDALYDRRICLHMLRRLENWGQMEPSPVETYTIEHIMPQNLSKSWKKMLGHDPERVHGEWLHRLGNLTLTGYNSKYSNRSFDDKKKIQGGFNESAVRLNKFVREQHVWTVKEMRARGNGLARRAIRIWPDVNVSKALVEEAEVRDLEARAAVRHPKDLVMSDHARGLFDKLDGRIRDLRDLIVTVERQSACYYVGSNIALEILPQKLGVRLLLDVEFTEVDDPQELAKDANDWKFIPNAAYSEWNLLVDVWSEDQIEAAVGIVRQTFDLGGS